ncbi:hypothetical protein PG993_011304 [Apiospora rasikravindrae]|uniref:Uncharacterized protein n=1 Tax=Apiospora rasikravindrae TaxID=990691 RepID=A0ABR1SFF9_9PEZI
MATPLGSTYLEMIEWIATDSSTFESEMKAQSRHRETDTQKFLGKDVPTRILHGNTVTTPQVKVNGERGVLPEAGDQGSTDGLHLERAEVPLRR